MSYLKGKIIILDTFNGFTNDNDTMIMITVDHKVVSMDVFECLCT